MVGTSTQITERLQAWNGGDPTALERLIPEVYGELRQIAARYLRRNPQRHSLQTEALINETYLRLVDSNRIQFQNRGHFFAFSAQLMRWILVDFARSRRYQKRGGNAQQVSLNSLLIATPDRAVDVLALDEALTQLATLNKRQAQVVELRFFGGLSEEEAAATLKVSVRTIQRDWNHARLWLYCQLSSTWPDSDLGDNHEQAHTI